MIYNVKARFREDTARSFLAKLTDGTIESQRPDGPELIASMDRAIVAEDGSIEWSQMCLCSTPLQHERATVLDFHFDDIKTQEVSSHIQQQGSVFMDHLRKLSESPALK